MFEKKEAFKTSKRWFILFYYTFFGSVKSDPTIYSGNAETKTKKSGNSTYSPALNRFTQFLPFFFAS